MCSESAALMSRKGLSFGSISAWNVRVGDAHRIDAIINCDDVESPVALFSQKINTSRDREIQVVSGDLSDLTVHDLYVRTVDPFAYT